MIQALIRLAQDVLCLLFGHDKEYVRFGNHRMPVFCRRCKRPWNQW